MNRRELLYAGAAASLTQALPAWAQSCGTGRFVGDLDLRVLPDGRTMQLLGPYRFIDGCGRVWDVPKGVKVDGASIPQPFWSVTGGPFEGQFRNASVIHDWFCVTKSRPWRQVHRMFLEGMLTAGVGPVKANIMYAAVMVGGPRWDRLHPGNAVLAGTLGTVLSDYSVEAGDAGGGSRPSEPIGGGAPREPAWGSAPRAAAMSEEQFAALARRIEREGLGAEQIDALAGASSGR